MRGVLGGTAAELRIRSMCRIWLRRGKAVLGRATVFAAGAIAGVVLAGCGSTSAGQTAAGASSGSPPAAGGSAPACTASDLRISNGPLGAGGSQFQKDIEIVNVSSKACLMPAEPPLRIEVAGRPEPVRYAQASAQADVRFGPGSSGVLAILIADDCTYSPSKVPWITAAFVGVSGRSIGVPGWVKAPVPPCEPPSASPIAVVPANIPGPPAPGVLAWLRVLTAGPGRPGGVLALEVTLTNTGATTVGPRTCPTYTITLFGPMLPGATKTTEKAGLPCGSAGGVRLEGHGSASYALTFKIPATAAPGVYKLYWLSDSFPGTEGGTLVQIG